VHVGGALASALGIALIALTLLTALPADATMSRHDRRLHDLLAAQGRSLVFLTSNPPYLQHPSAVLDNGLKPDGKTVFALTRGLDDFAVVADQPGRELLRLRILGAYNRGPRVQYVAWLERLREVRGQTVPLVLQARPPAGTSGFRVVFTLGVRRYSWQLDPTRLSQLSLHLTASGPQLVGLGPPHVEIRRPVNAMLERETYGPGSVVISLYAHRAGGRERSIEQDKIAYRPEGNAVAVLAPDGLVARQGKLGDPALQIRTAP
jgi:hypothetical protein